jgi:hypothetical protein
VKIIKGFPPNFAALKKTFGRLPSNVVFSYGDTIYAPGGQKLHPSIIAHEEAHGRRQLALGVTAWWDRYITDPAFRFEEELIGHRAEWQHFKSQQVPLPSATAQRNALDHMAKRLSGPLYGNIVGYEQAMREITA